MHKIDKIIKLVEDKYFKTGKIKKGDTLIIGLSGGPDSMCLFDIIYKLKDIYNYNLMAIHVHHGIRKDDADNDYLFVKKYCNDFRTKFVGTRVDAKTFASKNNLTLEEAARKLRYKEYDKIWKYESLHNPNGKVYLLVAHHMKDQAETVIHNLIRGTGIKGMSGMKAESGYIIRPLLDISKSEIDSYIKKYNIPYVIDKTNDDINYTRNFIRKNILSSFEILNNNVYEHISDMAKAATEMNEYVELLSKSLLKKLIVSKKDDSICVRLDYFKNTSHIIKVYIIREILSKLVSTLKDFTKIHFDDIIEMSMKTKGGHIDLPYNITVDKKQNFIVFSHNNYNISMKRKRKGKK